MKTRLDKQFAFIREIDKEKRIKRQTLTTQGVQENDAEHAWHMAVMTLLLSEYANEEIDVLKTISMLLIHDLVEIYAGDTYAYDSEKQKTAQEREKKAAEKLYALLPKDQEEKFKDLWIEFEEGKTPEAKFAKVMDRIQPLMLNDATNGKMWETHKVQLSQILNRNEIVKEGSKILYEYEVENFILPNVKKGHIIKE